MSLSDDDGHAISYKVLERGTPVVASDGATVGSVREVLENVAEHIFDGLVIDTPARRSASSTRPRSPASPSSA